MWRVLTVWLCLCNRKETTELRRELSHQKEEEKKAALQQLSRLKDEEIAASKRGWENIVSELQRQVWPPKWLFDKISVRISATKG